MTTYYLIRHGQKQPHPGEPSLTPLGHQQAALTAEFLARYSLTQLLSSPSHRTQQTAEYLATRLQLPVQVHPHLRERANWGDDPHQTLPDFLTMWSQANQDRQWQPPIGDSSWAAGARLANLLSELDRPAEHPQAHIAVVTHGGLIADGLRTLLGDQVLQPLWRAYPQGPGYQIGECSVTILQTDGHTTQLHLLASTTHLGSMITP